MRIPASLAAILLVSALCAHPAGAAETRCGWLANPTPANWWLTDADRQWIIMTQGAGDEPDGMDLIPDLTERDWVTSNPPNGGYACACLSVVTDPASDHIMRILKVTQKKIAACAKDPDLPKPE